MAALLRTSFTADVAIVGGGPAGLMAALVLARAGRSVRLVDAGRGRNERAGHAHNVFGLDGTPPETLRAVGRAQAEAYGAVFVHARAELASVDDAGVTLQLDDGQSIDARHLLLATGVTDKLPAIPGIREAWGSTAIHCPYCHGAELKGRPTAVLNATPQVAAMLASLVTGWTDNVTLLTNGPSPLSEEEAEKLAARGIAVHEDKVVSVDVAGSEVQGINLANGTRIPATALYLHPDQVPSGPLVAQLGLEMTESGHVQVDQMGKTSLPRVWACGDMAIPKMQAISMATSQAFATAAMINMNLVVDEKVGFKNV